MHFFLESHGFHYLLKFIKRLKPTPLLPLTTNFTHIHRLNHYSHLDGFQCCISGPEFSPNPHPTVCCTFASGGSTNTSNSTCTK